MTERYIECILAEEADEAKVWHEIMSVDGNKVVISNYGKDTDVKDVSMTKKEVNYCIKKGILIPA